MEEKRLDPKTEAEIETRRARAMDLRIEGNSYREIAAALGISVAQAFRDVEAVLERTKQEANEKAEKARQIALHRLDVAAKGLMPEVRAGSARHAEVLTKLEERRAKLIGLDAPEKREVTGGDGGPLVVATPEIAAQAVRELFGQHALKQPDAGQPGSVPPSATGE